METVANGNHAGGVTENRKSFVARWMMHHLQMMHHLHMMSNRDYRVLVIRKGARLVHYSSVTGRYYRWPFMEASDLQVGRTWSDADHRGKGLAKFALWRILEVMSREPARPRNMVCLRPGKSVFDCRGRRVRDEIGRKRRVRLSSCVSVRRPWCGNDDDVAGQHDGRQYAPGDSGRARFRSRIHPCDSHPTGRLIRRSGRARRRQDEMAGG